MFDQLHLCDKIRSLNEFLCGIPARENKVHTGRSCGEQIIQFISFDKAKGICIIEFVEDDHIPHSLLDFILRRMEKLLRCLTMLFLPIVSAL